jgi:hypothetical protein
MRLAPRSIFIVVFLAIADAAVEGQGPALRPRRCHRRSIPGEGRSIWRFAQQQSVIRDDRLASPWAAFEGSRLGDDGGQGRHGGSWAAVGARRPPCSARDAGSVTRAAKRAPVAAGFAAQTRTRSTPASTSERRRFERRRRAVPAPERRTRRARVRRRVHLSATFLNDCRLNGAYRVFGQDRPRIKF